MARFGFSNIEELLQFVNKNPEQEPAFWLALITSDVYVITLKPFKDDGSRNYDSLEIYTEKLLDLSERLPFFTSLEKLEEYNNGKSSYCKLNTADLFRKISEIPAVMNPGTTDKAISKVEISDILTVADDYNSDGIFGSHRGEIKYAKLSYSPDQLIKVLINFFEKRDKVNKAYFVSMIRNDMERILLIVDSAGSYRKLFKELSGHIAKHLYKDPLMMLSYETELAKEITQDINPFYTKVLKHRTDLMSFD